MVTNSHGGSGMSSKTHYLSVAGINIVSGESISFFSYNIESRR